MKTKIKMPASRPAHGFSKDPDDRFRSELRDRMIRAVAGRFHRVEIAVDPHGAEGYAIALATGSSRSGRVLPVIVGLYDKRKKRLSLSEFEPGSDSRAAALSSN